jgi:hypothetical protein
MCSENNRLRAIKTRKHQTFYLVAQEQHRLSPAKTFTHNLKEKQALGKSQNQNLKTQAGTPWLALPLRDKQEFPSQANRENEQENERPCTRCRNSGQ